MRALAAGYAVTKAELAALVAFATEDFTRAHIHGVQFACKGDRCTGAATDGHTLARATGYADAALADVFVPMAVAKAALKSIGKGVGVFGSVATVFPDADPCVPANTERMAPAATLPIPIDEHRHGFPPCDQVIPAIQENRPGGSFGIDTTYLARLALVAKACVAGPREKAPGVVQYPPLHGLDPVRYDVRSLDLSTDWTVVIMPMRVDAHAMTEHARKQAFRKWLDEDAAARKGAA